MLFCSMLPASFFFTEHRHAGNRWSLCAKEICYRNPLLGAFFQSGKTLPIEVGPALAGRLLASLRASDSRPPGLFQRSPNGTPWVARCTKACRLDVT